MAVGQGGGDRNSGSVRGSVRGVSVLCPCSVRAVSVAVSVECPCSVRAVSVTDSWSFWLNIDSGYVNSLGLRVCG